MRLNWTSELKVMTIWISWELPLFNFERPDMWCAWIGHPIEKLWPYEFLESFRCSISSISIYYALESDFRLKSYCNLNWSRASVVQFRASWYIMRQNQTCEWKVMTIRIAQELPLFNFEGLDILYAPESDIRIKIYDNLNFSRAFVVQFRASRYIMRLYRTSEWKVMTIWISRELPLFNFELLDISSAWIGPPSEKLCPFEFLDSNRCSISSDSIYYAPESDLRLKSYDQWNFSRASIVQFRASWYIMHLNPTSV